MRFRWPYIGPVHMYIHTPGGFDYVIHANSGSVSTVLVHCMHMVVVEICDLY